jgi:HSP20 family protein
MKLIRYNPFSTFGRVADFDDWFRSPFAGTPSLSRFLGDTGAGSLATDIHEDKDNYLARFEVPGVKKEDVKIELNDRLLTVSVEKKEKNGEEESSFSYSRSISVPDSVKPDAISAKLEDGMLTVTLPKSEERKPRNIELS